MVAAVAGREIVSSNAALAHVRGRNNAIPRASMQSTCWRPGGRRAVYSAWSPSPISAAWPWRRFRRRELV